MTLLASVQINQLYLRGDTRAKTALLASLDSQQWPGENDPRIIFINRIHIRSPWWMLARELAQQTEAEYRTVVTASQASAASNTLVFASEAHLVTQVLENLLRNQSPWYQQTWLMQTQLVASPMAVLLHRPVLVPEVLHQLNQRQLLTDFFVRCTEPDLHRLLTCLQDFLAVGISVDPLMRAVTTEANNVSVDGNKKQLPVVQLHWAEQWLLPLLARTQSQPLQQGALQLIACLGLWRFSPQHLRTPAAWLLWLGALTDKARSMELLCAGDDHVHQLDTAQAAVLEHTTAGNPEQTNARATNASHGVKPATAITENDSLWPLAPQQRTPGVVRDAQPADEPAMVDYCYIQQAGFLYCINWLRDFDGIYNLPAPFSPWLWLALLQRDCCRIWHVPLDESLHRLLLDVGGLGEQDVYGCDDESVVASLQSAREFLQRRLCDFHIEHYDWLAVHARVQREQAYLQVYLHESAVRLDVRLAGLDLNPGWVPWLGRVIYFHFGQYPDLCGVPLND